jgi:hypothetical protein
MALAWPRRQLAPAQGRLHPESASRNATAAFMAATAFSVRAKHSKATVASSSLSADGSRSSSVQSALRCSRCTPVLDMHPLYEEGVTVTPRHGKALEKYRERAKAERPYGDLLSSVRPHNHRIVSGKMDPPCLSVCPPSPMTNSYS